MAIEFNLEDFKDLDPQNVGNWPIPVKAVIIIVVCIGVAGALYYFITIPQIEAWKKVQVTEVELREDFRKKHWEAATLPKLREQLAEIESNLSELQRQLPSQTEVAGLIQDISQQAVASALTSELFKPGKEKSEQVYVEYPIQLELSGRYHDFGKFVSGVAAMPRIVTQHDVAIKLSKQGSEGTRLSLNMIAKIYRYREDEPEEDKGAKAKDAVQKK
jgi:type IV pilus assembly protein PilO